ncbi:MAG: class I SAM-dependent methyltransferase [Anaerolineae bacterium]|nr:class I SAM-dependent methyltransferase [Anaerolineae bacterium]
MALLAGALPALPAMVLDIGCGTGSLSVVLAKLDYTVTGIDLSEAMIAQARSKAQAAGYAIPFRVMDAADPDLLGQRFDAIVCRHLLWTLPDPAAVLKRWSRLLADGGRLVLIEGRWSTGVGLTAQQVVEALPSTLEAAVVTDLSDRAELWGNKISDERYMIIAHNP